MTRKTRKILFRFLLLPVLILILLVGIAVAVLINQHQRLVSMAVNDLNQKIPGRLAVEGSEISVFQNFPYISIALKNVHLYPDKSNNHALYEAERMFVGFSLSDILAQKYHIKVIALKNGHIDLVQDTTGTLNIAEAVKFSKDSTVKDTSSQVLDLAVKKLVLKNIKISFFNEKDGQHLTTQIERIQSALKDDRQELAADLDGKMIIDYTHPGDTTLFRHKSFEPSIKLTYNKSSQLLTIKEGKLQLEKAVFNIAGSVDLLHDNSMDLHFSGDKPDFKQLFSFAPKEVAKELEHFRYDGVLAFEGKVKGKLKGKEMPLIELNFSCNNAWLHNTKANKKLDSLAFKGYYTNGAEHNLHTSELRLLDMSAKPGEGVFHGNFVLRDFTDPKVLMQVNSELELGFVGAFLGIKDLQRLTGHISLKMDFKELVDLSLPAQSMNKLTEGIQSELTVRNLTFRVPNDRYLVEHLNLHANMKNGFVKLDSLSFNIGSSDFHLNGTLDDLPAIFHHQEKPITLTLAAHSNKMVMKELLAYDSAKMNKAKEEIYGFNIGLSLETSVNELRHPNPLPKGVFKLQNLYASFKNYPHAFHDFGADLTINDTALLLRNFAGNIDSSDIRFNGRVINYALWFEKVKKGKTQIAFDLKSQHLAMNDLLGRISRTYVPKDYQQEVGSNIWLRSKWDLKYDSSFQFASIHIANISGQLKNHAFRLDSVSGNVKFGVDNFVRIDTLKGRIGNSDFNMSMRLYNGKDTNRRKKENYFQLTSHFLDVDQLTNYRLTAEEPVVVDTSDTAPTSALVAARPAAHDSGFNIFQLPFIDFNASVNVDKIKFKRLWLKNFASKLRMTADQQLYLDTLSMGIADGTINARAHFNGSDPNRIYLRSRINVEDVNIEKLMLKLDYLGQDYVINKNIMGTLSGQVTSYVQVHPDLTPMMDQTEATLDLEIINGTLVNFAPMQAMSSYFKDKNLSKVRFDTLRNTLTFKKGTLVIPDMNINSSLGFMEIAGTQAMNMQMEYYVRIPLKMVTQVGFHMLFGKKQEEVDPDQVDAIEYRDKNKRIRFMNLKIAGTPDAYKVSLGKAKKTT